MNLRMPAAMRQEVRELAEANGRSMAEEIRAAVTEHLALTDGIGGCSRHSIIDCEACFPNAQAEQ